MCAASDSSVGDDGSGSQLDVAYWGPARALAEKVLRHGEGTGRQGAPGEPEPEAGEPEAVLPTLRGWVDTAGGGGAGRPLSSPFLWTVRVDVGIHTGLVADREWATAEQQRQWRQEGAGWAAGQSKPLFFL